MSEKSKLTFINDRPVRNKYCIMTTVHMLEVRKESYQTALKKYEGHLQGLTDKYYNTIGTDISSEDRDEITDLHSKIYGCEENINNINKAIAVISDSTVESSDRIE